MKLYKAFPITTLMGSTQTINILDEWIRTNHKKYNYQIAGITGNYKNGGLIILAYWPK